MDEFTQVIQEYEDSVTVVMDRAVAQMLRNELSGCGKGLRASGLSEAAEVLDAIRRKVDAADRSYTTTL